MSSGHSKAFKGLRVGYVSGVGRTCWMELRENAQSIFNKKQFRWTSLSENRKECKKVRKVTALKRFLKGSIGSFPRIGHTKFWFQATQKFWTKTARFSANAMSAMIDSLENYDIKLRPDCECIQMLIRRSNKRRWLERVKLRFYHGTYGKLKKPYTERLTRNLNPELSLIRLTQCLFTIATRNSAFWKMIWEK